MPVFDSTSHPEGTTFTASTNAALHLRYWDENAYASELTLNDVEEQGQGPPEANVQSAADAAAAAAEKEGLIAISEEAKNKKRKGETKDANKAKKVIPLCISSTILTDVLQTAPAHLQFWSNRHAELHGLPSKAAQADEGSAEEDEDPSQEAGAPAAAPVQQSYADLRRKCCLLCSRQFKADTEVHKHERLSKLHVENMQNADLKAKALAKLSKAGITPGPVPLTDDEASEYRDRAKERRYAFGGKKVQLPLKKAASQDTAESEQTRGAESSPAAQSKGASLLSKMGWSAGQGLGAQGTGVTAPIAAEAYAAGVGLGAEGGRIGDAAAEAGRQTKGDYKDFVERAKEKAKERFAQMNAQ